MIAILALLGVPLWVLLGWFGARLWHRHDMTQVPKVFKLKARMLSGDYRHMDDDFGRFAGYGVWAHDVLIVEKGFMVSHVLHFPVSRAHDVAQRVDPDEVKGLGDSPMSFRLRLDNDSVIEIVVDGDDEDALGPFFSKPASAADTSGVPSQSSGEIA